jgi:homoaconitase
MNLGCWSWMTTVRLIHVHVGLQDRQADLSDGEGSAREHAALQPRFYGCQVIVARSFARIHETNLKVDLNLSCCQQVPADRIQKQGILPLWFSDKSSYSLISAHDRISTIGLESLLSTGSGEIKLKVTKPSGEVLEIKTDHTMSQDQLEWLRAGSALNYIGQQAKQTGKA